MTDYAVTNPATGEVLATYPTATDAEVQAALAAADEAFRTWGRTSAPAERADLLRKVAELHRERRDELAAIIVREMGKPLAAAEGEVDFAADITEYYADHIDEITGDTPLDILGEGTAVIRRAPLGVLLGIMPWNFPYYQVARFAAPNLAVGNTILLKHASQCPESAAAIAQMYADAGFPAGAYVDVRLTNDQAAEVIADRRVQGVSVTGSERAGAAVAEIAGQAAPAYVERLTRLLDDVPDAQLLNPEDGRWLLRAPGWQQLSALLDQVERPPGRLRLRVDPLRL